MADLRYENKNNQKKVVSAFSCEVDATNIGDTLFTLPAGSMVTAIIVQEAAGGEAGESVLGGIAANTYYPTGATVTLASGTTGAERIVVTYVEVELTNGQYTD